MLIVDGSIVLLGAFVFGWTKFMYAIIILYIISFITDKVLLGISDSKAFYIITSKQKEITKYVIEELGHSITVFDAKGGFLNEKKICEKFDNWETDLDAQEWLVVMGYSLKSISKIIAIQIPTRISKKDYAKYNLTSEEFDETVRFKKADAQVQLRIKVGDLLSYENISIKKANVKANFNQIDKRPVDTYQQIWKFSDDVAKWLKLFTGALIPSDFEAEFLDINIKTKKRLLLTEIPQRYSAEIIKFFLDNKITVISDVLRGRGMFAAEWMLVTKHDTNDLNSVDAWKLVNINQIINHYSEGNVEISPKGSLRIGRITLQRKGGTPDPTSLQFKFKPLEVFDI
jgi:hypothetical protein